MSTPQLLGFFLVSTYRVRIEPERESRLGQES